MPGFGRVGEDAVAGHYRKLGFRVLERNYIFPKGKQIGELDLIVARGNELVFVEVKARRSEKFGTGFEAVDAGKQARLVKMAKLYLALNSKLSGRDYRIDVAEVGIDNGQIYVKIISNAIEDLD